MGHKPQESSRLEAIAVDSWYAENVNARMIRYSGEIFSRYWRGSSCLELGPAEGIMTDRLAAAFTELTVVDGSEYFCSKLRDRLPAATVVHSLFEEFEPDRCFDTVVLGHVLEHVDDPVALLARARDWLSPDGGKLLAAVPNARSLHRQAAVTMGLMPHESTLNETDIHHGHRRVYDPERFRADFLAASLKIDIFGGFFLKPISNAQLDAHWGPDLLDAYMILGERYPDVAAEIYVVASR